MCFAFSVVVVLALDSREPETVPFQIDPHADEFHPFALQQPALLQAGPARQQDPAAAAKHSLPGQPENRRVAQCPGDLPCSPRMARGACNFPIGRHLAGRYAANCLPDIVEIPHGPTYQANEVMSSSLSR
jgi:hypothetical protein